MTQTKREQIEQAKKDIEIAWKAYCEATIPIQKAYNKVKASTWKSFMEAKEKLRKLENGGLIEK